MLSLPLLAPSESFGSPVTQRADDPPKTPLTPLSPFETPLPDINPFTLVQSTPFDESSSSSPLTPISPTSTPTPIPTMRSTTVSHSRLVTPLLSVAEEEVVVEEKEDSETIDLLSGISESAPHSPSLLFTIELPGEEEDGLPPIDEGEDKSIASVLPLNPYRFNFGAPRQVRKEENNTQIDQGSTDNKLIAKK